MKKELEIMEENRRMIESERFKEQYRKVKSAFTRIGYCCIITELNVNMAFSP